MAYIIQVSVAIREDQMSELSMGAALQRVLSCLRTLLPNEPGYVTSRAMLSLEVAEERLLIFQSVWRSWEELVAHRQTALDEARVLTEFEPHISAEHLSVRLLEEVD